MNPYRPIPSVPRFAMAIRARQALIIGTALLIPFLVVAFACFERVAAAQTASNLTVTSLTPYSVVVVVISLLVGVITQAINSGKVLGQFQVPPSWMVVLGILAPFLAAVVATLTQAGALNSVSIFNSIVAGIVAIVAGAAPGAAVHLALHAHLQVPKYAAALRKAPSNDNTNSTAQKPPAA